MQIKDKHFVVVGATGGIGREIVDNLVNEGVTLISLVARDRVKLDEIKTKYKFAASIKTFDCNIIDAKAVKKVCEAIIGETKMVDILINAAGVGIYKTLEDTLESEWDDSFAINVRAPFLFSKYLLPAMNSSKSPVIINLGSGMGVIPKAGRIPYCASKFALRGFSLTLSKEFENTKYKCVHLTMGSILTEFGPLTLEQKEKEALSGKAYFTPKWLASKIVNLLIKDELEEEIELYPTSYKQENSKI